MSVNTMFAVRTPGCTVVCAKREACRVVGECTVPMELNETSVVLPTGELVARESIKSNTVEVRLPADPYRNNLEGLCGAYSPPHFNDTFTNGCGEITPGFSGGGGPRAGKKYAAFHKYFGNTWKVEPEDTLFPAGACEPEPEQNSVTTTTTVALPFAACEDLREQAESACESAGGNYEECLDDIGVTCELDKWLEEAKFAEEIAESPDVEKPMCHFDITATPGRFGSAKHHHWTGPCGSSFAVKRVPHDFCAGGWGLDAFEFSTSTGHVLGYLGCSNQDWEITDVEKEIDPHPVNTSIESAMPTPAPTGVFVTEAPTPRPAIFTTQCKASTTNTTKPLSSGPPSSAKAPPSASGDPHLVNIRGERFDIYKVGQVEFLRVPYQSKKELANFTALATIQDVSGSTSRCEESRYITSIMFGGAWLGERALEVSMDQGHMNVLHGGVPVKPSLQPLSIGGMVHAQMLDETLLHLQIGAAKIVISRDIQPVHFFLNVQATALGKLGYRIGGLLGEDNNADVSTPPAECRNLFLLKTSSKTQRSFASASV